MLSDSLVPFAGSFGASAFAISDSSVRGRNFCRRSLAEPASWATIGAVAGTTLAAARLPLVAPRARNKRGLSRASKEKSYVTCFARDHELLFTPGQSIIVTQPAGLAGKTGTVVGPAPGNSLAVRFESGSVFNMLAENIQDASQSPAEDNPTTAPTTEPAEDDSEDEPKFAAGQRVMVIWPLALSGKQGDVIEPTRNSLAFSVRFPSGSVFHIHTENLEDVAAFAAATAPRSETGASESTSAPQELEFTIKGHRVVVDDTSADSHETARATQERQNDQPEFASGAHVLVSWPPAVAGRQGTVVGTALADSFAVQFESGNVFNIQTEELRDANSCCGHSPCCRVKAAQIRARKKEKADARIVA
mmetsp:Transcript_96409/g.171385  ORF Transcript_96409/g.171385 Transcript_96409/m.171385 type:complete len:362 (+) Transcript_96409:40-1125(+)